MEGARIGLTGVTGHLGGKVLGRLAGRAGDLVLLARTPSRVEVPAGATVRRCDYADAVGARAALEGVQTLLMVSGAETPDRVAQHRAFIDAAVEAGVRHLVYTSFYGAAPDATFTLARDHWATEQHLLAAGVRPTILRDNLYADFIPMMVVDGAIRGPAGDGRAAVVAQDDIADVVATVLLAPGEHPGVTYDLTGPEALTFEEMARVTSEATGEPVRYQPETLEEAYASRAAYGAHDWQVDAWVSTYTAVARGELAGVSDAVPRLTGHPATSLREVLTRAAVIGAESSES